jgi:hypothetical protein
MRDVLNGAPKAFYYYCPLLSTTMWTDYTFANKIIDSLRLRKFPDSDPMEQC